MKNNILIILFCITTTFGYSQKANIYWFSIPNTSKRPIANRGGSDFSFNDKILNSIFKKYNTKKIKKSFPTSKTPLLQTIFEIEVEDKNMIEELKNNASNLFLNIEKVPEIQLLYLPNDFGTSGGNYKSKKN
ncbi:hypothetical protein A8C32_07280 [Flavivirga aquatica]|uniref:Uncharacterized protein n=1 Tax=Flavivirga aquatica TaxID=1849968 RepID=A0A1E5SIL8_9FLAO|nr:hypothetical protein [Flavivirga aquatica]OEJ98977.1 hypothetical protein A8C32_07280 [Flavivirga aquatica]